MIWLCCFLNDVQVFYFSDVVLTNYLAYGMLQVNMIWQEAVMPTQCDNNGATYFLTQLASSGLHSLSFEELEILTSALWCDSCAKWYSCAQRHVLFQKSVQYCSGAGVRPGLQPWRRVTRFLPEVVLELSGKTSVLWLYYEEKQWRWHVSCAALQYEVWRISSTEPARMDGITICGIMLYLVSRVKN